MRKLIAKAAIISAATALAACETTVPTQQPDSVDPAPPQTGTTSGTPQAPANQSQAADEQQRSQSIITLHLAQQQPEQNLIPVDVGDGSLHALPQPVLTQAHMASVTPVTAENGSTHILIQLNEDGAQRLQTITSQAQGHFLLLSVNGQLVSVSQIGQTIDDGGLLIPTQNQEHSNTIIRMMQQPASNQ